MYLQGYIIRKGIHYLLDFIAEKSCKKVNK